MEEIERENPQNLEMPKSPSDSGQDLDPIEAKPAVSLDRKEIFRALEIVERDSVAIAESYASLFSSLRLALSEVTSISVENMQCFSDIVGSVQESALDAATKGNRYINSCLRLSEELKGIEDLALQLKTLRKNVDALDSAVDRLVRLP